jgi:hypothetical protein
MNSLLDSSFRHRFVIPTNADVGASRVKGRCSSWTPFFASVKKSNAHSSALPPQVETLALISVVIPWAFFRGLQKLWSTRKFAYGVPGKRYRHRCPNFISFHHVLTAIFHVRRAVQGHHDHPYGREWVNITDHVNPLLAELLGREFFSCLPLEP